MVRGFALTLAVLTAACTDVASIRVDFPDTPFGLRFLAVTQPGAPPKTMGPIDRPDVERLFISSDQEVYLATWSEEVLHESHPFVDDASWFDVELTARSDEPCTQRYAPPLLGTELSDFDGLRSITAAAPTAEVTRLDVDEGVFAPLRDRGPFEGYELSFPVEAAGIGAEPLEPFAASGPVVIEDGAVVDGVARVAGESKGKKVLRLFSVVQVGGSNIAALSPDYAMLFSRGQAPGTGPIDILSISDVRRAVAEADAIDQPDFFRIQMDEAEGVLLLGLWNRRMGGPSVVVRVPIEDGRAFGAPTYVTGSEEVLLGIHKTKSRFFATFAGGEVQTATTSAGPFQRLDLPLDVIHVFETGRPERRYVFAAWNGQVSWGPLDRLVAVDIAELQVTNVLRVNGFGVEEGPDGITLWAGTNLGSIHRRPPGGPWSEVPVDLPPASVACGQVGTTECGGTIPNGYESLVVSQIGGATKIYLLPESCAALLEVDGSTLRSRLRVMPSGLIYDMETTIHGITRVGDEIVAVGFPGVAVTAPLR